MVYTAPNGNLWVGHRTYGAFRYDGQTWARYDVQDGLADNAVGPILQTADGSVWAGTQQGISRFDGQSWTTHALPPDLRFDNHASLRQSVDGALWMNWTDFAASWQTNGFRTIRYRPDDKPPETGMGLFLDEVSQPGNTTLAWTGGDPWRRTPDSELQYAWRLDGGAWSPFALEKSRIFEALPGGAHTFEVKARDRDFNEDPTPAAVRFTVVPPIWQQPWFIVMVVTFMGIAATQASRIVVRDRKLRESNTALSSANKELFGLNEKLGESNQALTTEITERERAEAERSKLDI